MSTGNKHGAVLSIELDAVPSSGRSMVCASLVCQPGGRPMHSFSGLFTDAEIAARLPGWMAELRAEAELGRVETLDEERQRLAGSSSGSCCTVISSLNATCTSLSPDGSGPRSLVR